MSLDEIKARIGAGFVEQQVAKYLNIPARVVVLLHEDPSPPAPSPAPVPSGPPLMPDQLAKQYHVSPPREKLYNEGYAVVLLNDKAVYISHAVTYSSAEEPTVSDVLDALRIKYGSSPVTKSSFQIIWAYDVDGQPYLHHERDGCAGQYNGITSMRFVGAHGGIVTRGIRLRTSVYGWLYDCDKTVVAEIDTDRNNARLINGLAVSMADNASMIAAFEAFQKQEAAAKAAAEQAAHGNKPRL
jgi:hypothetical protein